MPLYIGDLSADTMHLGPTEFGIYMRLIMHCWQHGKIPTDDRRLALISHCDSRLWHRYRQTVLQFFDPVDASTMQHKRVCSELLRYEEISNKRKAAALQKHSKRHANEEQVHTQSQSQSPKKEKKVPAADAAVEVVGEDERAKLFRIGKTILVSFGVQEKRTGALIGQWLKAKNDPAGLLAALQFSRDRNVAEPVAYVSAIIHGKSNGVANGNDRRPGESLSDFCGRLAAEARRLEAAKAAERADDAFGNH